MSKGVLLAGTAGGIIGAITAAIGVIWSLVYPFNFTIPVYGAHIGSGGFTYYVLILFEPYPYSYLFNIFSFVLAIFLTATSILIGIGFYGTYKIGGGAMGVVGLISSIIGITLGALLILMANLTSTFDTEVYSFLTDYALYFTVHLAAFKPNWLMFSIGLLALGITFILLGSASISVREMTVMPSASNAAGILSIIGAVVFIIDGAVGIILKNITIAFTGFGLIFVVFILWAVVFYSSKEL